MTIIGIDFEGRSRIDIREVGATKYAADPSSSPICLGYASHEMARGERVSMWTPDRPFPVELANAARSDENIFVAHNSQFDRTYWRYHITAKYGVSVPKNWICTATRASANGLPRGLDEACSALGLPGKDKEGQKALKKLYAPDKKTGRFLMPEDAPDLYQSAYAYCKTDIVRMFQVFDNTKPISQQDQLYFEFDQRMNERGFALDADGVDKLLEILEDAYADIDLRSSHLPSLTSPKQLLEFCKEHGCDLPNLQAQTVTDFLKLRRLHPQVREALELRQLAGLAAPKKLAAFKQYGQAEVVDGKRYYVVRDSYVVNGAHTGRHTSKGAQSQNLKRDCATESQVEALLTGDLELVKLLGEEPLKVLGLSIRPMVIARRGVLLIGDFSKIETCVTFWFAGHKKGLADLAAGKDLYKELATDIFRKALADINKDERQVGKHGILGLGFGSGSNTFWDMCNNKFGVKISTDTSDKAVSAYRTRHHPVVTFWRTLEGAIKSAIMGTPQKLGPLKIAADKKELVIILPSRRKLRYQSPSIRDGKIRFWHVDPKTHQWCETAEWGGGFTNNVVQSTANDLQREASLRLEAAGFEIVMSSHDELVAEAPKERLDEFLSIMALKDNRPSWTEGIPVSVEGKATLRYRKG